MRQRTWSLLLVSLFVFACSFPNTPTPGSTASPASTKALAVQTDASRNQGVLITADGSKVDVKTVAEDGSVVNCVNATGVAGIGDATSSKSMSTNLQALIVGTRSDGWPGVWLWAFNRMQAVMDEDSGKLTSCLPESSDRDGIFRGRFGWVYHVMGISENGEIIVGYAENTKGISLGNIQVDQGTTVGVYWQISRHPIRPCFVASRAHIIGTLDQSKLQNLGKHASHRIKEALEHLLGQLKLFVQGYYSTYLTMVEENGVSFDKSNSVYLVAGTDQDDNPAIATIDGKGNITITPTAASEPPNIVPGSFVGTAGSVAEGASLAVSLVLNNPQSTAVKPPFGVDFYLAMTSAFSPSTDKLLDSISVSSAIGAGSSITIHPSLIMPTISTPNQDVYLYAVVSGNVSVVADAAVVLVYDSSNGSRTYKVILQTYDPTSPATTNPTPDVTPLMAYYKESAGVGVYQDQADPGGPGYGYQAIGAISTPLTLGPGTYYVTVQSYADGPYAMAVITGNIALHSFATALTSNGQDTYEPDNTPFAYPINQNLPSLPTNPVHMNLGSMVNRYISTQANGDADWFTFTLP